MRQLRGWMDTILKTINIALFAFMTMIGTYQILVRYLFNRPSTVSEELLTYSFAWMSLLAAAYMFGERGHMRMGFAADRLKGRRKRLLNILVEILTIIFAVVVLLYGGFQITALTMTQKTASLGIPMGYVYSVVPVCGILILVYSLMNLAELIKGGHEL